MLSCTVKLHWPDRWCKYCLQETEYLPGELYQCPSCLRVTTGNTQYIQGEAEPLANYRLPQADSSS